MKMNKKDCWLIERWEKTRQLEIAMNETRQRFKNLFYEIHKNVKQTHPALDRLDTHLNPKEIEDWGGDVIFSNGGWPSDWETWRTGFHICSISLDELSSEQNAGPSIHIFFQVKKSDSRIEEFRQRINAEAPGVFQGQKIIWKNKDEDDNRTLLWYPMPEGKKHILKMLCDGNEQEFVNYIANHVSLMCGFIPILDKLFTK
jgi:hypothetical protein